MRGEPCDTTRRQFLHAALLAPALGVAAAAADPAAKPCRACKGTGRLVCTTHAATLKGKFQVICSQCRPPDCCGGLGWRVCKACSPPDVQAAWEAELEAWKAEARHEDGGYPDRFGEPTSRAATLHFRIQGPFTHKQFHDYGEKVERCHAAFLALFGQDAARDLPWTRCQVGVFQARRAYEDYCRQVAQGAAAAQPGWLEMALNVAGFRQSRIPRKVTYRDGHPMKGRASDEELQHSILHAAGHIYLDTWKNTREPPAWLGEGFAGYCETVVLGSPTTYCIAYGGPDDHSGKGRWYNTLKAAIAQDTLRSFEDLSRLQLADMNGVDWAQSIAIVNLLALKPEAFAAFVLALKGGADAVEAVDQHYQLDPKQLRALWQRNFRRSR